MAKLAKAPPVVSDINVTPMVDVMLVVLIIFMVITPMLVKDLQTNRADKTVYVKADARARFASVTDVIDNLRTAQVDSVGLLTEEIKDKNKKARL